MTLGGTAQESQPSCLLLAESGPYFDPIYDHNGAPDPSAARGKLSFPMISNDPVCHNAAFSKGFFLKFFWETKETKLVFNARKSLIGVGVLPIRERAWILCNSMSDGN